MASFRGHAFREGAEGALSFPVWTRKARSAILDLPGANEDIVQRFGRKSDTLALLVTCSASELDLLYGDVGATGTLIYHAGSFSAYLDSIDGAHAVLDADLYPATLNLIKQS